MEWIGMGSEVYGRQYGVGEEARWEEMQSRYLGSGRKSTI